MRNDESEPKNPHPEHREFIMTGCTSEEWQKMFGDNDEEEEEVRPWTEGRGRE
jgi:hypothetical protein